MDTVTTTEIEDAFKAAIAAITPSYVPLQDACRWAYVEAGRSGGRADLLGRTARSYTMIWRRGSPTYIWVGGTGTAYATRCAVATSYAGIDPQQLQHMLTADGVDLRRALNELRDPTLPGLCDVIDRGLQNEAIDDQGNVYIEHMFEVHWHQETES